MREKEGGPLTGEGIVLQMVSGLGRKVRQKAGALHARQARYLVDSYYQIQDGRKARRNQLRTLDELGEPNEVVLWFAENYDALERSLKSALDKYSAEQPLGQWARQHKGVGPVIAAGFLAHIDVRRAATAGAVWRFAGMDPSIEWYKNDERAGEIVSAHLPPRARLTPEVLATVAAATNRTVESLTRTKLFLAKGKQKKWDRATLKKVLKVRPWNAQLKTLCWKLAESFVKFHNDDDCEYGHAWLTRKTYECEMNEKGRYAKIAAERVGTVGKGTDAHPWYAGCYDPSKVRALRDAGIPASEWLGKLKKGPEGSGMPMLPPGHIHARSERWVAKLFLSHYWETGRGLAKLPVSKPYPIAHLDGHTHYIPPKPMPAGAADAAGA